MSTHTSPQSKATKTNVRDGFSPEEVKNLSSVLNALLADVFALYLKTKNFHWHMSGPHFRDYHLLLDEQADADLRHQRRHRRARAQDRRHHHPLHRPHRPPAAHHDNDQEFVPAHDMLLELHADNRALVESLRAAHEVTDKANDYATTSLIEVWIDEAERRAWFLFEATR